jgi:hypothetical protein
MAGPVEATNAERGQHRMLALAWSQTPVGSPDRWPESLRAAVDLMLGSSAPIALFVGPQLVQMHNRRFAALYRDERSAAGALGRSLKRDDPENPLAAAATRCSSDAASSFAGKAGRWTSIPARSTFPARRYVTSKVRSAPCSSLPNFPPNPPYRPVVRSWASCSIACAISWPSCGPWSPAAPRRATRSRIWPRTWTAVSGPSPGSRRCWSATPMPALISKGLVRDELLAQNADDEKVRVRGPEISLPSKPAEVLALAIHELATNAMKYGALAQASGNLEITWRLEDARTPRQRLEFVWTETGVRVAGEAPRREGFGTNLLKRRLPYELAGRADVEFRPGGLVCQIAFPFTPAEEPGLAAELINAKRPEDFA